MIDTKNNHYKAIDGLRAYSAIGIIMMHVLANGRYGLGGFMFDRLIPSFTNLVYLFMIISGFSICCGYYDKLLNNKITLSQFYNRRYVKIWPFFAFLCILDIIVSPNKNSLYEAFANLTLCFGLLPNVNISVIGVGWFLGVIFVFYLVFPFFCFLLSDKRRAWFSFAIMLIFNKLCADYFFDESHVLAGFNERTNFVFCAAFFFVGGLVFLYKDQLVKVAERYRYILLIICVLMIVSYYIVGASVGIMLAMFSLFLIHALGNYRGGVFVNPATKFLSSISMELYLSHMVIFRILEKTGLANLFGCRVLSYFVTVFLTVIGTIIFILVVKQGFQASSKLYLRLKQ